MFPRGSGIRSANHREGRYVLVPDRKAVRELLTRYASLRIAQAERHTPATARELDDVSYTLCVMMGTSDISDAIAKADVLLLTKERSAAADTDGENGLTLVG
ncbi:DUF5133 domain-containing protein [Streptomyces lomondensis]|uniref:DUF5133 domain-containing protein n=1 Tax=Streptomyces lomondensis TaxID=68229 RepID=A0ABQ2XII7_9ACTN|nr:DUF5133 domain-containing protein [Streptomyces lomondensis]